MRSNSFEITFARVHAHAGRKDGHLIELAGPFEAMVSAFGGVTPDCVTVMVGAPRALAEGRLALWIDLDRATCPRVSDEMVKAIASDKGAFKVGGWAAEADAWDEAAKECLSEKDAAFQVSNGEGKDKSAWTLKVSRRGAKTTLEAGAEMRFDAANARIFAELLRAMPFR